MATYTTEYAFTVTLVDLDKRESVDGEYVSKHETIYQWGGVEAWGDELAHVATYKHDLKLENKPRMTRKAVLTMVGELNIVNGKVFVDNERKYHGNCFAHRHAVSWYEIKGGKIVESGKYSRTS